MTRADLELVAAAVGLSAAGIAPPHTGTVAVAEALRLTYLDWGGGGPDVLFLHGGGLNAHSWDGVCLHLQGAARCVALDQRGHGDSDWSVDAAYTVDDHAGDVAAVVAALGLRRPVLVGQSMGGLNGLCAVARRGVDASGVVLVDIAPGHSIGAADELIDEVRGEQEPPSFAELRVQAMRFNRMKDERLADAAVRQNLRRDADGRWGWKHDAAHLDVDLMRRTRASANRLVDELEAVRCPLAVVRGERSRIFSAEDAAAFAKRSGAALVTVPGAGHNVQGDQPRALAEVIRTRL